MSNYKYSVVSTRTPVLLCSERLQGETDCSLCYLSALATLFCCSQTSDLFRFLLRSTITNHINIMLQKLQRSLSMQSRRACTVDSLVYEYQAGVSNVDVSDILTLFVAPLVIAQGHERDGRYFSHCLRPFYHTY